jgi:hypothetical protein
MIGLKHAQLASFTACPTCSWLRSNGGFMQVRASPASAWPWGDLRFAILCLCLHLHHVLACIQAVHCLPVVEMLTANVPNAVLP